MRCADVVAKKCSVGFSRCMQRNSSDSKNSDFEPEPSPKACSAILAARAWLVETSAEADATMPLT